MHSKSLVLSVLLFAGAFAPCVLSASDLKLYENTPGSSWESEFYPVGNGTLGAMTNGGIERDELQLNIDSLWTGDDCPDGNYDKMGSYQNFGSLFVRFENMSDVSDYRRELDLEEAVIETEMNVNRLKHERKLFISAPDKVLCYTVESEQKVSGSVSFAPAQRGCQITAARDMLTISGKIPGNNLQYRGLLLLTGDGAISSEDNQIVFRNCKNLRLLFTADTDYALSAASNFRNPAKLAALDSILNHASARSDDELEERHKKDYARYFDRVEFELENHDADLPTSKRIANAKQGRFDTVLPVLMFQYGRYLLISSSRPGSLPANLQGIWNNSNNPAWHSDYHTNINIQMNYWGAEPANLPEMHRPLFDFLRESIPAASAAVKREFPGNDGFAFRTSMNPFGGMGWKWNWPGAAWLAMHMHLHWQYTADLDFLKNEAYPYYQGCARFWVKYLKTRPDGTVVVPNGWSPEHGPAEDGIAHDQQIVAEFFDAFLSASHTLNIQDELVSQVARLRKKLLGHKIGKWGQLQEWETDRDVKGDEHRHTSHLYAVYPGSSINAVETPDFFRAARVALEGRTLTGDSRRSWTWPWRTALWARFRDGVKAQEMIRGLLQFNTLSNLFTNHPPFQMDGNFGFTGALCELFLQCPGDEIHIMPCSLPQEWSKGSLRGLCAKGAVTVDIDWENGSPSEVVLSSKKSASVKVVFPSKMTYGGQSSSEFSLTLQPGTRYQFKNAR